MRRKISEIMDEYLQDSDRSRYDFLPPLREMHLDSYNEFPVSPVSSDWALSPCGKKLERQFTFPNVRSRNAFVLDIMELENSSGHHVDYNVSDTDVFVVLQTKDLNMVTDLDLECSKRLSDCAVDVRHSRL